jgi:predicted signal transduction protein with EAL and GGDEF domain
LPVTALAAPLLFRAIGVGYSSLGQLKNLPVRTVKIDRLFITNMVEDQSDASLVRSIIEMSRLSWSEHGRRGRRET